MTTLSTGTTVNTLTGHTCVISISVRSCLEQGWALQAGHLYG